MKLIRYDNPLLHSPLLGDWFDQSWPAFGRFISPWNMADRLPVPAMDLYEDGDHYYLQLEVPGVKKDALQLEVENGVLTLRLQQQSRDGQQTQTTERQFRIPEGVLADQIKARQEDGLLTITLPKQEASKPRQIRIA